MLISLRVIRYQTNSSSGRGAVPLLQVMWNQGVKDGWPVLCFLCAMQLKSENDVMF